LTASSTSHRSLVKTADLTNPHLWYPMARAIKRRIIYHAGPTNSGKTYQALQACAVTRHDMC
jgi:ATP-dependent RNA helicase SUPV3L1/SUV3